MEVVLRIRFHRSLQIRHRCRKVTQFNLRDPTAIKRIRMVGARRNSAVVAGTSACKISVIQIKQSEFLQISRGRIVDDGPLQFVDSPAPGKYLEGTPQKTCVRDHLHGDIDQGAYPMKQNHPNPEEVWAASNEVHNRDYPQQDRPPRKGEEKEGSHSENAL